MNLKQVWEGEIESWGSRGSFNQEKERILQMLQNKGAFSSSLSRKKNNGKRGIGLYRCLWNEGGARSGLGGGEEMKHTSSKRSLDYNRQEERG